MGRNILFGIIWILLLLFIAWPVAGFCAGIWIFLQVRTNINNNYVDRCAQPGSAHRGVLQYISIEFMPIAASTKGMQYTHVLLFLYSLSLKPFEALFPFVKQITAMLEKLITWPRDLGVAIKNCQESFPSPM